MRRCAIVVLGLLVSATAALAEPEVKGSPTDVTGWLQQRTDRVRLFAYAEENAKADKATMRFSITTERSDLGEALAANQQLRGKAAEVLYANGIEKSAVKSSGFSSIPVRGFLGKRAASYEVQNKLSVEVSDEKQMQAAAELSKLKEVTYAGVRFEYTKRDELRLALIQKATQKLNASREAYEKAMGVKLVPLVIGEQMVIGERSDDVETEAKWGPIRIGQDSVGFTPVSASPASARFNKSEIQQEPVPAIFANEMTFGLRIAAEYAIERQAGK